MFGLRNNYFGLSCHQKDLIPKGYHLRKTDANNYVVSRAKQIETNMV